MRLASVSFAAFVFGVFLLVSGCTAQESRGPQLPESHKFTLTNLQGEEVSLDGLLGQNKAVLINFWATWCPPCLEEIPDLIRLHEEYKDNSFTVLGVDVGESHAKVSRFVEKMGINYPVVLDEDMDVTRQYGVVGIPTTLLVDSEGRVLGQYHGFTRRLVADVEKALQ